ncbi:MAG TPA: hypothetical protein VLA88_04135 [Candidatus Saccharimonadales bacterium]|nr:hypothetical protein [Candidatus Saccharimonadales bacterium]
MRARITLALSPLLAALITLSGCGEGTGSSEWNDGDQPQATATHPAVPTEPQTDTDTGAPLATIPPTETPEVTVKLQKPTLPVAGRSATGFHWQGVGVPSDHYDAADFADQAIRKAIDPVWSNWLNSQSDLHERLLILRIVKDAPVRSQCLPEGNNEVTPHSLFAFVCPLDDPERRSPGILYLPSATYARIWDLPLEPGEQNLVGVVVAAGAHAFGVIETLALDLGLTAPSGISARLVAACYAGVWTRAVYPGKMLTPRATNAAVTIMAGSVGIPPQPGEPLVPSSQLKTAYDTGLTQGNIVTCGQYWPGTSWS